MTELLIALASLLLGLALGLAVARYKRRIADAEPIALIMPEVRALSDEEKVARAVRAKFAMEEFLAPALRDLEAEYLTALTTLAANEPWETGKITKLAVAQRVITTAEQHIIRAVLEGELAGQELHRAKKIAALPEAKRRWAK